MTKKPTLTDLTVQYGAQTTINNNNTLIENSFENTLSLDGSAPNQMQADFDLNSNNLLNANEIHTQTIVVAGDDLSSLVSEAAASAAAASTDADDAAVSASEAAVSAASAADILVDAVLDSELTDSAAVKALDQGVATTDSPVFVEVAVGDETDETTDWLQEAHTGATSNIGWVTRASRGFKSVVNSGLAATFAARTSSSGTAAGTYSIAETVISRQDKTGVVSGGTGLKWPRALGVYGEAQRTSADAGISTYGELNTVQHFDSGIPYPIPANGREEGTVVLWDWSAGGDITVNPAPFNQDADMVAHIKGNGAKFKTGFMAAPNSLTSHTALDTWSLNSGPIEQAIYTHLYSNQTFVWSDATGTNKTSFGLEPSGDTRLSASDDLVLSAGGAIDIRSTSVVLSDPDDPDGSWEANISAAGSLTLKQSGTLQYVFEPTASETPTFDDSVITRAGGDGRYARTGYGLGTISNTQITDFDVVDSSVATGWYVASGSTPGAPWGFGNQLVEWQRRASGGGERVTVWQEGAESPIATRTRAGGAWNPWRYLVSTLSSGQLIINSLTTDVVAIFKSSDAGAQIVLSDNAGAATLATNGGDLALRTGGASGTGTGATDVVIAKADGSLRFIPLTTAPASPQEGDTYYDFTVKKVRTWDGTAWQNHW